MQVVKHKEGFAIVSEPREIIGTGRVGSKWFWSDGQWSRAMTHGNGAPAAVDVKMFPTQLDAEVEMRSVPEHPA